MRPTTIGAVLAGGRSTRMREPKALIELRGRTLLERAVAIVGAAGLDPLVVAKPDSELPPVACPVLAEPGEPRHPLAGIVAALDASGGGAVVAVACDMPLVPPGILSWLAALDGGAAVCEVDGRLEPLLARYPARSAAAIRSALARGAAAHEAVRSLGPRIVGEAELRRFGDPARIVFNVNTPADLARAEMLLMAAKLVQ